MDGIINLLKPSHMSSHDAIYAIRNITGQKKIGHLGTLDPMAVGVLPIFLGKATRVISYVEEKDKEYICELKMGLRSDTEDIWGRLEKTDKPCKGLDPDYIMNKYTGHIMQRPPIFSAIWQDGERLYKKARRGEDVEVPQRPIFIENLKILRSGGDRILFSVTCSKGTYVRSLCRDIGEDLGCGAVMSMLIRKRSGSFNLEDTVTLEDLREDALSYIKPMDTVLGHMKRLDLSQENVLKVKNGMRIRVDSEEGSLAMYGPLGFIGIGDYEKGILHPKKIVI